MVAVGGRDIPDTESQAISAGWIALAVPSRGPARVPAGSVRYQKSCLEISEGDLCDAVVHPDGNAEATYCNKNKLCARAYRSP